MPENLKQPQFHHLTPNGKNCYLCYVQYIDLMSNTLRYVYLSTSLSETGLC